MSLHQQRQKLCHRTNLSKYGYYILHFATKTKYLTTKQVGITQYNTYNNTTPNRPDLKCFIGRVVDTEVYLRSTSRSDPKIDNKKRYQTSERMRAGL